MFKSIIPYACILLINGELFLHFLTSYYPYYSSFLLVPRCFTHLHIGVNIANAVVIGGPAITIAAAEGVAQGAISTAVSGLASIATTGAPLSVGSTTAGLIGGATGGAASAITGAGASTVATVTATVCQTPTVALALGPVGWALIGAAVVGATSIEETFDDASGTPLAVLAGSFFAIVSSTISYLNKVSKVFHKSGNVLFYAQAVIVLCYVLCFAL